MTGAGLLVSFLLLASVAKSGESLQPISVSPSSRELRRTLSIRLVDEAQLSPKIERLLQQEVEAIWKTQGIDIEWLGENRTERMEPVIFAMLRPRGGPGGPRHVSVIDRRRTPLGWIRFDANGQPANLIEVSYEAVWRAAHRGRFMGLPIHHHPIVLQDMLVGRALGRVVAHEIGHWLLGPKHAGFGLMKPGMSPDELLDFRPPQVDVPLQSPARRGELAP